MDDATGNRRRARRLVVLSGAAAVAIAGGIWMMDNSEARNPPPDETVASAQDTPDAIAGDTPRHRKERARMVDDQIAARGIRDPAVLRAMTEEPRHLYVPEGMQHLAYRDHPLPIGHDQTISQPYIVARMTEALALKPGDRVLEVGTGSGYQAAILDRLGAETYTIEIVAPLCARARADLDRMGHGRVRTRCGDGWDGWPEAAPFDAILVTAAPGRVPPRLVEQLAPGGRLVIPVGDETQWLRRLRKDRDGTISTEDLDPVRFVPMTGKGRERTGPDDP
jgi:protein-L-isoaspartate(D-aspartate) O-methyltransferase